MSTKNMIYIGIDPGLDGGIAVLDENIWVSTLPVVLAGKKRNMDEQQMHNILVPFTGLDSLVTIELVSARPGQGVTSMFRFGTGWGFLRGICVGLGLPYQMVRPQEWQKVMMKGQPKGSEYLVASRLWPGIDWRKSDRAKKPHDGMVDAALIAEYSRRACEGRGQDYGG